MTELITDKDEIKKIINEKIRGKKIILSDYYELGIDKKGIQHERVLNIFPQFEKVIAIEKKILKYGDIGYELFYRLDNDITFSIATCPKNDIIRFIHAIEYKRSLQKRFKM